MIPAAGVPKVATALAARGARRGGRGGRQGIDRPDTPPEQPAAPHVPVLIGAILQHCAPIRGVWLDGTLGAGGYALALLEAGAERVIGVDRDPQALALVAEQARGFADRLRLVEGRFSDLDSLAGEALDGVVLDLGVSSMQLDLAERGFSFMRDGPLDMRMGGDGPSAADLVAATTEAGLADSGNITGDYVTGVAVGENGVITVSYDGNETFDVTLTPDASSGGSVTWECTTPSANHKWVPSNCRNEAGGA